MLGAFQKYRSLFEPVGAHKDQAQPMQHARMLGIMPLCYEIVPLSLRQPALAVQCDGLLVGLPGRKERLGIAHASGSS